MAVTFKTTVAVLVQAPLVPVTVYVTGEVGLAVTVALVVELREVDGVHT